MPHKDPYPNVLLSFLMPMADSQNFVLMLHPNRLQGFIWKAILKSQQISVIWETPDTDLKDNLIQLDKAGLTFPRLLIIDMQCLGENPYAFCRWCRDSYPSIKLVLTNHLQQDIAEPERNWAVNQGAADLLPGFQQDNLVSSATTCIRRVLKILDRNDLNDGALISVLLKLRRELESRQTQQVSNNANIDGTGSMGALGKEMNPALNQPGYAGQPNPAYGAYAQQIPSGYGQHPGMMGQAIPAQGMPIQPMNGQGINGPYPSGQMPVPPMNGQFIGQPIGQYPAGQVPLQPINGQLPAQCVNGYPVQNAMPGNPVPGQPIPGQQLPGQMIPNNQAHQTASKDKQSKDDGKQKFRRRYRGAWY